MNRKVATFKFTRNDLISRLKKEGVFSINNSLLEKALKQVSLTYAVTYYLDNS